MVDPGFSVGEVQKPMKARKVAGEGGSLTPDPPLMSDYSIFGPSELIHHRYILPL